MKISKDRLKEIIKEELTVGVVGGEPAHHEMKGGEYPKDPHGYEGEMAKTNLWKIAEYAQEMHELIADDENLEPWVEEKIAVASYMMDQIGHHLQYKKHRGHEEAEGEKGHADFGHHEDEYEVEPEELEDEEELVVGDELCEDC